MWRLIFWRRHRVASTAPSGSCATSPPSRETVPWLWPACLTTSPESSPPPLSSDVREFYPGALIPARSRALFGSTDRESAAMVWPEPALLSELNDERLRRIMEHEATALGQVQTLGTGKVSQQRWSHGVSANKPGETLVYDGIVVGRLEDSGVTLNLGWLREAGAHVKIVADPEVDKTRGGIVLER